MIYLDKNIALGNRVSETNKRKISVIKTFVFLTLRKIIFIRKLEFKLSTTFRFTTNAVKE